MNRRDVLRLSGAAGAALTGCLGGGGGEREPVVSVSRMGFVPQNISVETGATVTWVNENETVLPRHTVTSDPFLDRSAEWSFDAELAEEGDEASYTFEEDGLYTYVDAVSENDCRCGLVAVGDASYDDPLPCSPVVGGGC